LPFFFTFFSLSLFPFCSMSFLETLFSKTAAFSRSILFPDALDERTLAAARALADRSIVKPILCGEAEALRQMAKDRALSLEGVDILDPKDSERLALYAEDLYELRKEKGVTREGALELALNPLYFAALALRRGDADGAVGGSISATSDVLRAGIQALGVQAGIKTVSSFFLMVFPDRELAFADCGVVPAPTPPQLADIAIATAQNYERLTGNAPVVAFLSFSTKGSAEHESVARVREALQITRERSPNLIADGELQFDAAFVPSVGARKAPGSPVAGKANVFIFPDLNAGNIGYKIAERLGGAQALGPIVQGLSKPYLDLSRGCKTEDIVAMAAIAALMA
jgi:phosphate acetyltransferase